MQGGKHRLLENNKPQLQRCICNSVRECREPKISPLIIFPFHHRANSHDTSLCLCQPVSHMTGGAVAQVNTGTWHCTFPGVLSSPAPRSLNIKLRVEVKPGLLLLLVALKVSPLSALSSWASLPHGFLLGFHSVAESSLWFPSFCLFPSIICQLSVPSRWFKRKLLCACLCNSNLFIC